MSLFSLMNMSLNSELHMVHACHGHIISINPCAMGSAKCQQFVSDTVLQISHQVCQTGWNSLTLDLPKSWTQSVSHACLSPATPTGLAMSMIAAVAVHFPHTNHEIRTCGSATCARTHDDDFWAMLHWGWAGRGPCTVPLSGGWGHTGPAGKGWMDCPVPQRLLRPQGARKAVMPPQAQNAARSGVSMVGCLVNGSAGSGGKHGLRLLLGRSDAAVP